MKTLLALVLLAAQSAERPAWEVADRWTCVSTQWRMCEGFAGECTMRPGNAVFWIDFPAAKLGVAATVSRFDEPIVARHFMSSGVLPGASKISLGTGDTLTIAARPRPGASDPVYDGIVTRSGLDGQRLYYSECRPN
jgi:hypothetical protein